MKNKGEYVGCFITALFYLIIAAVIISIPLGIAYLISVSDLPEWLKFWLLR